MSTTPSPFLDPAEPILRGDPALSDEHRKNLWDIFHLSKDPNELAQHLQPLVVPESTKHALFQAKQASVPPVEPLDKAFGAIQKLAQMDPKMADFAEAHPNLLKTLTSAATTEPKAPQGDSAASKSSGKGKTPSKAEKTPSVTPDVPPTPSGHALVYASDGGLHHIPAENIEAARAIDPALKILHVEP
jgi:hypothetical protein